MSFLIDPFRIASTPASIAYVGFQTVSFAATVTATGVAAGDAASNRHVFLLIGIGMPGTPTYRSLTGVTIGGVVATIHGQTDDTTVQFNVALVSAPLPTGTTADIALTFSGGGDGAVYIASYAVFGLLSDSPVDMANMHQVPSSGIEDTTTPIPIDVLKDGIVIGGASYNLVNEYVQTIVDTTPDVNVIMHEGGVSGGTAIIDTLYSGAGSTIDSDASLDVRPERASGGTPGFLRFIAASFR